MGFTYSNAKERREANRLEEERLQKLADNLADKRATKLLLTANKIAMVVSDKISNDLIRPGPHPEERECYQVAQELRDMNSELVALIVRVLDAEAIT